jgi:hypothetical protein
MGEFADGDVGDVAARELGGQHVDGGWTIVPADICIKAS